MQKIIRIYKITGIVAFTFFIYGCASTQVADVNPAEKLKREFEIGTSLAKKFEMESSFRDDRVVTQFLEEIAKSLTAGSASLRNSSVRILILKDQGAQWRNFSLPGTRIYLSRTLLRTVKFENELAAPIALELGHLERRDVLSEYEKLFPNGESLPNSAPLRESGVFDFTEQAHVAALESAMELMYQAGFDPRGMVHLLNYYKENPTHSPYNERVLASLIENSWRIIALHAPLRNPIVRSDKFLAVYQRMQKL